MNDKELLLINRNKIFNSFEYRFFSLGRDKIKVIDEKLDEIEEKNDILKRTEIKEEISLSKDIIEKINKKL